MKAMILAAGRGKRMRPLTDDCPKPLLTVLNKPLIVYHIEKLVAAGITDIVINHAWKGEKIEQLLGDGSQWQANICYSPEPEGGLETAGGIVKALPLLGDAPFVVVNGDIYTDYDFSMLPLLDPDQGCAHLVMVENPAHNPDGDFLLSAGVVELKSDSDSDIEVDKPAWTFAGLGVYHPDFFKGLSVGFHALRPVFEKKIKDRQLFAELYLGDWTDVGTPERLAELNNG